MVVIMGILKMVKKIYIRLPALMNKEFRMYLGAQTISFMGSWIQNISMIWLVLQVTNSPLKVGIINALQFLPTMFLTLVIGVITDKFSKRKLLLLTQIVFLTTALILTILTYTDSIKYWNLVLISLIIGIFNAIYNTVRQSFTIELTGEKDLFNGIALNSTLYNLCKIVGPSIAGLLIAFFGVSICFFINAISYIPFILVLVIIKKKNSWDKKNNRKLTTNMLVDIKNGITYVLQNSIIYLHVILLFLISVFLMNYTVQIPIYASDVLKQSSIGYGFLMSAVGIGAFLGAGCISIIGSNKPRVTFILLSGFFMGITTIILGIQKNYWISVGVLIIIGFTSITFTTSINTLLQLTSKKELLGRVVSIYTLVYVGAKPIGNLLTGTIVEKYGIEFSFKLSGFIGLIIIISISSILFKKNIIGFNKRWNRSKCEIV